MKNTICRKVFIILLFIIAMLFFTHTEEVGRWMDSNVFTQTQRGLQELLQ